MGLEVIVLIKDVERGKVDIYDHLDSARRSPKKRAHELVELLEDESVLTQIFGTLEISKNIKAERNRYSYFCKKYIIYVFNHFIFDEDDVEIMLVAFNYHPNFEYETRIKYRRDLFARRIYEPKHRRGWGDSMADKSAGLREEETRIMKELSEVLAELAVTQGGTLNIVDDVLAEQEPAEVVETVDPVPDDVEPDNPPETNMPSQLIPLMRVERAEGAHQNSDFDKGELSLMPKVFVDNRADATNITNVQVVVVMPGTTKTTADTCKQSSIEPKTAELAPQPKPKRLPSPKPTPIPHRPPQKSFWLIILALIIIAGLGVICLMFFHPSDPKEPDSTTVVSPENAEPSSGTIDASDNSGPGLYVQADENNDPSLYVQADENNDPGHTVESSSPRNNVQE